MREFDIVYQWESSVNESPEENQTSSLIKIFIDNNIVTRNENEWSKSIHDDMRVSAYPLALWLASSWWRLRWEPLPMQTDGIPPLSWRMAHEMIAAGHGYLWPRLLFASDRENIQVWAVGQAENKQNDPIRYLNNSYCSISGLHFERKVDEFINGVLARLDAVGLKKHTLHELWSEVLEERNNPEVTQYRKIEAMLGWEPDEGSQELIDIFLKLNTKAGEDAVSEIATACVIGDPKTTLNKIISITKSQGIEGRIDPKLLDVSNKINTAGPTWERGRLLAHAVRNAASINDDTVSDDTICDLVGITTKNAFPEYGIDRNIVGLATREINSDKVNFHFRRNRKVSRRFEISRFLCEHLMANKNDSWLPLTDAKTARQKVQRAFAAEFLCPINNLVNYLSSDFSKDSIEDAADYFKVSPLAVETQLVNNRVLRSTSFEEDDTQFSFPYNR